MISTNVESLLLQNNVIIINETSFPQQENMFAWAEQFLSRCELSIQEHDQGADLHQYSFKYEQSIFILSLSDLSQSIWIDAVQSQTNQQIEQLLNLLRYLQTKLYEK